MPFERHRALFDSIHPESPKFTSDLLFVHGMWSSARVWRRFMGYCAHRGWTCHAVRDLEGLAPEARIPSRPTLSEISNGLSRLVESFAAPPILIGHDLGASLALMSAKHARAMVALAPLDREAVRTIVGRLIGRPRLYWANWRGQSIPAGTNAAWENYLGGPDVAAFAVAQPAYVLEELLANPPPLTTFEHVATLVVAGSADPFSDATHLEATSIRIQAEFQTSNATGHALPWATGWDKNVALVHRWLVQTLGETLLIPRDPGDDD